MNIHDVVFTALTDQNETYRLGLTREQIEQVASDADRDSRGGSEDFNYQISAASLQSRDAMVEVLHRYIAAAVDRLSPTLRRQKLRAAAAKRLKIRTAMQNGRHHHFAA